MNEQRPPLPPHLSDIAVRYAVSEVFSGSILGGFTSEKTLRRKPDWLVWQMYVCHTPVKEKCTAAKIEQNLKEKQVEYIIALVIKTAYSSNHTSCQMVMIMHNFVVGRRSLINVRNV